eukprot:COSAG01_NODE_2366_length_7816_cov_3.797460_8_plen_182_part_00
MRGIGAPCPPFASHGASITSVRGVLAPHRCTPARWPGLARPPPRTNRGGVDALRATAACPRLFGLASSCCSDVAGNWRSREPGRLDLGGARCDAGLPDAVAAVPTPGKIGAGRCCQLGGACLSVGRGAFVSGAGRFCQLGWVDRETHHRCFRSRCVSGCCQRRRSHRCVCPGGQLGRGTLF